MYVLYISLLFEIIKFLVHFLYYLLEFIKVPITNPFLQKLILFISILSYSLYYPQMFHPKNFKISSFFELWWITALCFDNKLPSMLHVIICFFFPFYFIFQSVQSISIKHVNLSNFSYYHIVYTVKCKQVFYTRDDKERDNLLVFYIMFKHFILFKR